MRTPYVIKEVTDSGVSHNELELGHVILSGQYGTLGQYKFTDVKLQINRDADGVLSVQRAESDAPAADAITRSKAYITLISFDGDQPRPETATPVYSLIPTLVQVTDPFARANEFAEVFALLRWAKQSGARWLGQEPPTPNIQPATALLVDDDGTYTFGSSAAAFSLAMANRVHSQAAALALKTANKIYLHTTDELHRKFSDLIYSRAALQTAGSETEVLGAAFAADPALSTRYPEAARQALIASPFRGNPKPTAEQIAALAWIGDHIDDLNQIVSGLKARKMLRDSYRKQGVELSVMLSDPLRLFNLFTGQRFAKAIDQIKGQLRENTDRGDSEKAIEDKIIGLIERELPGFTGWFTLESTLMLILNFPR